MNDRRGSKIAFLNHVFEPIFKHNMNRAQKIKDGIYAALVLGAGVLLNSFLLGKFELCVFRSVLGVPCPGCGLVHAALSLILKGDLRQSLQYHLLLLPIGGTIFFSSFPYKSWGIADFINRQRWWHHLLFWCLTVYYLYRLWMYFPSENYPMVYDSRNYLAFAYSFILNLNP